ncbi:hypothetical protein DRQ09_09755 [candidate division KSB1 bacterium]|nr:MAG: hypothetical protein DRQ09_09755 [candidate division KSB1 bacterium]
MIKKIIIFIFVIFYIVIGYECSNRKEKAEKISVVASILPLKDFTRQVGGKYVDVEVLVPPGSSPHTYEPTPAQLKRLSKAKLLVLNGIGLEYWDDKVIKSVKNPDLMVIYTAEGLDIINELHPGKENSAEKHEHTGGNPHVWLDPINAIHQVEMICTALVKIKPEYRDYFVTNKDNFVKELRSLDEEFRARLKHFTSRNIITFHSGYDYFIRRYGLKKVAVLEEFPGKEPTPARLVSIIELVRKYNIKAIFAEPQFPTKIAEVISSECGIKVAYLDPLGKDQDYSYIKLMRYNFSQLERFLKYEK